MYKLIYDSHIIYIFLFKSEIGLYQMISPSFAMSLNPHVLNYLASVLPSESSSRMCALYHSFDR